MKDKWEDRHKYAVYESTLSTADAVPLPQGGRQRGGGFAAKKEANCTCQQKLDTKLKKLGIKIEYLYKIQ